MAAGVLTFAFGMHNIDNAWNLHAVSKLTNIELSDSNLFGTPHTLEEVYRTGIMLEIAGLMLAIIASVFMAFDTRQKFK